MRHRPREQKPGIKNENIDRQIWVLHQAMADKLIRHPELLAKVNGKIETRYQQGKLRHGGYLTWLSILELFDQPARFKAAILEDSLQMRRLRRQTPLVGILNESERQDALNNLACGELPSVLAN